MKSLTYGAPTDKCGITVRLGVEKGFFRDEGIDLEVKVIYGGPELAAAYSSASIPIGEMGSPPCITAISKGANLMIVGSGVRRKAHMYLAVRSDIEGWQNLKGKRIGLLSRGSCPEWFLRAMLLARGMDPEKDVSFVGLSSDYARVVEVVREGRIDAALAVEPAISEGEAEGLFKVWGAVYEDPAVPQIQWIVRVGNRDFVRRERPLVDAVLRACRRSSRFAADNVDEWIDFSARHYRLPRQVMAKAVHRDLPHLHFDGDLDLAGLRQVVDLQRKLGAVNRPLELKDILDEALL